MALDYESIRKTNIGRYGTEVGNYGKLIFEDQYTERTHFIFELLQNAEDALARRGPEWNGPRAVSFELTENQLRVSHFGDPFNAEDVKGICQIGNSTKEGDLTAIGRFGIGFKSVYAFTDQPGIHSGSEDFVIDDYVLPKATLPVDREDDQTIFVIPLKSTDGTNYNEIANALTNLRLDTLLFLHHIDEISYSIVGGISENYLRESVQLDSNVRSVTIINTGRAQELIKEWLVFSDPVFNNGNFTGNIEIAFERDPESQIFSMVLEPRLVVFFPTVVATGLGFLIQGPYRTTPSRETVPSNDEWNNYLMDETASLLSGALRWLRDKEILDINVLLSLPLEERGDMFDTLYESIKDILQEEALLPKLGSGYVNGKNAVLGRGKDLRKLLSSNQLSALYDTEQRLAWLSGEITQHRVPHLHRYIRYELEVDELGARDILPKLSRTFLEKQSDNWILQLYTFLDDSVPAGQVLHHDVPLIRLEDGSQVTADPNKYFLPGKNYTDFPTVRVAVCETTEAREFLESLKLREPDPVDDVKHNILKKYQEGHISIKNFQKLEHEKDMERIIHVYNTCSPDEKRALIGVLKQVPFVRAVDADNKYIKLTRPTQLYLKTKRLETLLNEVDGVWFVDDSLDIFKNDTLKEILQRCGSACFVRPIPSDLDWSKMTRIREKGDKKKTSGINDRGTDWELDKLNTIISRLADMDNETKQIISELLWEELLCLIRNAKDIFEGIYKWSHYGNHSRPFNTMFVEQLNSESWIPDENGKLKTPSAILFQNLDWEEEPYLLSKIRFKPPEVAQLAEKVGIDPDVLDELKELGIKTLSDLTKFLGVNSNDSKELEGLDDDLSSTKSDKQGSFVECLLERMTIDSPDGAIKPISLPPGGPTTKESAVKDKGKSAVSGRSGTRVHQVINQFELTDDAKALKSRFRDMWRSDYQGKCQICGTLFLTRKCKEDQTFVSHIVPPSKNPLTNYYGNLLGLCGWHYALISYGQWSLIESETGEPINSPEQLYTLLDNMEIIEDDNNCYIEVPVEFYKVYRQWQEYPETIEATIRYSKPHWDYLCELLKSEEQSDD